MFCPVCRQAMSEVAPTLFQCGFCGAGPNASGWYPFWAMFAVDVTDDGPCSATCIEARGGDYQIYCIAWRAQRGRRLGDLQVDPPELLPRKGSSEFPLPVIVLSSNPASLPPGLLSDDMFTELDGPKEVVR